MVTPWRRIKGAEPDAMKVASPVLNGEREETGEGPRLALTQLECDIFRCSLLEPHHERPCGRHAWHGTARGRVSWSPMLEPMHCCYARHDAEAMVPSGRL